MILSEFSETISEIINVKLTTIQADTRKTYLYK
jgi:hypothetical protein